MKKILVLAVALAGLASGLWAQNSQIDLGGGIYDTDPTGVYAKNQSEATYGQKNKFSPTLNWNGKYTYTAKLDDANTFKFALADDGWFGLYKGDTDDQIGEAGQNAGKITPSVQWIGNSGLDITLSLPVYYFNPADKGGLNTLKYAYKESGYLPIGASATKTGKYPLEDNSVLTTTALSANYKYSIDKTTWVSGGLSTQLGVTPAPVLISFLPKVSGGVSGFQLDVQFDDYNSLGNFNATASGPATASDLKKAYSDYYLEPKLTYDFGFPGWVAGLKGYVSSRISLATTNPVYNGDNLASGKDQAFHDTFVQPGVTYSYPVAGVGTFGIDAGWRFAKIDNVGSINSSGALTGTDASTTKDVAPYSDLRIALSYSNKF